MNIYVNKNTKKDGSGSYKRPYKYLHKAIQRSRKNKKLKYTVYRSWYDSKIYEIRIIKTGAVEFVGNLPECYAWVKLTEMGIKIKEKQEE